MHPAPHKCIWLLRKACMQCSGLTHSQQVYSDLLLHHDDVQLLHKTELKSQDSGQTAHNISEAVDKERACSPMIDM